MLTLYLNQLAMQKKYRILKEKNMNNEIEQSLKYWNKLHQNYEKR